MIFWVPRQHTPTQKNVHSYQERLLYQSSCHCTTLLLLNSPHLWWKPLGRLTCLLCNLPYKSLRWEMRIELFLQNYHFLSLYFQNTYPRMQSLSVRELTSNHISLPQPPLMQILRNQFPSSVRFQTILCTETFSPHHFHRLRFQHHVSPLRFQMKWLNQYKTRPLYLTIVQKNL